MGTARVNRPFKRSIATSIRTSDWNKRTQERGTTEQKLFWEEEIARSFFFFLLFFFDTAWWEKFWVDLTFSSWLGLQLTLSHSFLEDLSPPEKRIKRASLYFSLQNEFRFNFRVQKLDGVNFRGKGSSCYWLSNLVFSLALSYVSTVGVIGQEVFWPIELGVDWADSISRSYAITLFESERYRQFSYTRHLQVLISTEITSHTFLCLFFCTFKHFLASLSFYQSTGLSRPTPPLLSYQLSLQLAWIISTPGICRFPIYMQEVHRGIRTHDNIRGCSLPRNEDG